MVAKQFLLGLGVGALMAGGVLPAQEKLPGVEAIPQNPKAFLEKDYRHELHAWEKRMLLTPAQKRWEGKSWAAEASVLAEELLRQSELEGANVSDYLIPLAPRFRPLMEGAGDDPLIQVLAAEALYEERRNWRDSEKALERAMGLASGSPAALEQRILHGAILQKAKRGLSVKAERARLLEAAIRAVGDGSYESADEVVFVRQQIQSMDAADTQNPDDLVRWQKAVTGSSWPEWVKLTLEGFGEVELAWLKRSSGWADNVNREQWRGFAEHLKVARDILAKANRLRPDRPEAASNMIRVCMGESVDIAELRGWFDRAVSAQFDYMPAYQAILWAYRPRWLGSHELMLAFGRACAETKRYDTAVPSRLMTACLDVTGEVKNPIAVFRHELVKESLSALSKGYLEQLGTSPLTHAMRVSNAAMCAWLADDDATAAKALKAAGPQLHPVAVTYLNGMMMHEKMLRAEVAADVGDYGEAIRAAANPAPGATLKQMAEVLAKIDEKGLNADALAYLKEGRDMVGFEADLEKGRWVPVKPQKHLTNYYITGGHWSVEEDGTLLAVGDDTFWAKMIFRVPTKADLEMRFDVSFEIPKETAINAKSYGFGPMLRWLPETMNDDENGVRFTVFKHSDGYQCAQAYRSDPELGTPDRTVKLQPLNKFSVRMAEGMISYDLNDRSITSRYSLKKLNVENEAGFIGFSTYRLPWGGKVKIQNIEVRKITGKELVSQVKKVADPAPVERSVTPPESKPLWKNKGFQAALLGGLIVIALLMQRFMKTRE